MAEGAPGLLLRLHVVVQDSFSRTLRFLLAPARVVF
jgi:hypothetical protein